MSRRQWPWDGRPAWVRKRVLQGGLPLPPRATAKTKQEATPLEPGQGTGRLQAVAFDEAGELVADRIGRGRRARHRFWP